MSLYIFEDVLERESQSKWLEEFDHFRFETRHFGNGHGGGLTAGTTMTGTSAGGSGSVATMIGMVWVSGSVGVIVAATCGSATSLVRSIMSLFGTRPYSICCEDIGCGDAFESRQRRRKSVDINAIDGAGLRCGCIVDQVYRLPETKTKIIEVHPMFGMQWWRQSHENQFNAMVRKM
jgi:hypothetical protein